jgi:hypothetical protein
MGKPYQNTISGLLKKRSELMGESQRLREALAHVGNDIEALDRTLVSLGYDGDLRTVQPRGNRVVFFARDELRRFLLDELRKSNGPVSSRDLAERIIGLEGKDVHDRRLRNDMVKRVGKSLKLLRRQGLAESIKAVGGNLAWRLRQSSATNLP